MPHPLQLTFLQSIKPFMFTHVKPSSANNAQSDAVIASIPATRAPCASLIHCWCPSLRQRQCPSYSTGPLFMPVYHLGSIVTESACYAVPYYATSPLFTPVCQPLSRPFLPCYTSQSQPRPTQPKKKKRALQQHELAFFPSPSPGLTVCALPGPPP